MSGGGARSCALVAGLALVAGCFSERPRPAPPLVSLSLAKLTVRSPDTLNGSVRASDPDGIDSVWLTVDLVPVGNWDGALEVDFTSSFRVLIGRGFNPGDRLPLRVSARDVAGFRTDMDTAVTVSP